MATTNLGRVQGAGFFYTTASSGTSVALSTITPNTIKPLVGDCVIFPNGDLRKVTAVSASTVTCGNVVAGFAGMQKYAYPWNNAVFNLLISTSALISIAEPTLIIQDHETNYRYYAKLSIILDRGTGVRKLIGTFIYFDTDGVAYNAIAKIEEFQDGVVQALKYTDNTSTGAFKQIPLSQFTFGNFSYFSKEELSY